MDGELEMESESDRCDDDKSELIRTKSGCRQSLSSGGYIRRYNAIIEDRMETEG
jgi:hypothetical protein